MRRLSDADFFYPARDIDAVLDLRRSVWGGDHPHTTAAFFSWLFGCSNPDDPAGIIVKAGGRAIGFAALCSKRLTVRGREDRLAHGLDYMLAPDISDLKKGALAVRVAAQWVELARQMGHGVSIVFPNASSQRILTSKHVALRPMFKPVLMVRPLAGARAVKPVGRCPAPAVTLMLRIGAIPSCIARLTLPQVPGEAEFVPEFTEEFDQFWAEAATQIEIGLVRDATYLNWRYGSHPVYDYLRLAWRKSGRLCGWMIASPRDLFGLNTFLLVDYLAPDKLVGQALLESMVAAGRERNCAALAALAIPGTDFHQVLRSSGFHQIPARVDPKPFRTAATASEDANIAWNAAGWHFAWGDIDVV